jgi:hypothetical protein
MPSLPKTPTDKTDGREMVYSSLQRLVPVQSRAKVITTHAPSTSDAREIHTQPIEESIASLVLRLR